MTRIIWEKAAARGAGKGEARLPTSQPRWMSHLVIVRHGESQRNVHRAEAQREGRLEYHGDVRDMDVALTPRGLRQARETGKYLGREFEFDRVFVSPYERTLHTAATLLKQFPYKVELTLEERIREKEFGILDGLTGQGIRSKHPDEWQRRQREGKYYYRPPGGESYPDVALRVHSFLGTLARDFRSQSVLVVCHSVVVLTFRRLLERLTEKTLLAIDRDPGQDVCNCSVTWYAFDPGAGPRGGLVLREFNGVHYSARHASTEECGRKAADEQMKVKKQK